MYVVKNAAMETRLITPCKKTVDLLVDFKKYCFCEIPAVVLGTVAPQPKAVLLSTVESGDQTRNERWLTDLHQFLKQAGFDLASTSYGSDE